MRCVLCGALPGRPASCKRRLSRPKRNFLAGAWKKDTDVTWPRSWATRGLRGPREACPGRGSGTE
eukprot:3267541-Alexandrium_andersonii.AAC.1